MCYGGLDGWEPPLASLRHHASLNKSPDCGAPTFRRRVFVTLHNLFQGNDLQKNYVPFDTSTDASAGPCGPVKLAAAPRMNFPSGTGALAAVKTVVVGK